jgi:hypothetical protein
MYVDACQTFKIQFIAYEKKRQYAICITLIAGWDLRETRNRSLNTSWGLGR